MPTYEFTGCSNKKCPDKQGNPDEVVTYLVPFSMKDVPGLDSKIACPTCRRGKVTRVVSSGVTGIVRGGTDLGLQSGDMMRTRVNGQDINVQFIDHPHTDPTYQKNLKKMAKQKGLGALSHAYYSEKHGGLVVDVASNVPDPLGKIARARREGNVETKTRRVNAPVATKPAAARPIKRRAGGPKPAYTMPIRRG